MLADGTVIDRSLQYMMVDKSTEDKSQWRGMSGFRRGHVFIPQAMEAAMGGSRARPADMTVILALRASAGRCADASDAQAKVDATVVPAAAHAVLLLDRAGWHTTAKLDVPSNITPIFLPSRAPELNPVENIWQFLRGNWL